MHANLRNMHKASTAFLLAPILLAARQARKLSRVEVAFKAGLSDSQLSRIERGLSEPSLGNFFALCDVLKLNAEEVRREVVTPRN